MRRILIAFAAVFALTAGRVEALTIRDLIELTKAGLGDEVLIALIEVDRRVFSLDPATLRQLKEAGVSEPVIVALIRSGRTAPVEPVQAPPAPEPEPRKPEVIVVDHHDPAPAPAPVAYPVYVPVVSDFYGGRRETVRTTLQTDQGLVRARVPVPYNCVKAAPVYWGFGGRLRPGSWQPDPIVVCR
jgi:hypothetical protein